MGEKTYFISYTTRTETDKKWAIWIEWFFREKLEGKTVMQKYNFRTGDDFKLKMHEALLNSDYVVCVLTHTYLGSINCTKEWLHAERLIPIKFDDCKPGGLFTSLNYVDLCGLSEDAACQKLLCELLLEEVGVNDRPRDMPKFETYEKKPEYPVPSVVNCPDNLPIDPQEMIFPDQNESTGSLSYKPSMKLRKSILNRENLSGVNLKGSDLTMSALIEANLERARLDKVDFSDSNLNKANLRHADIRNARLNWATLQGADLQSADLEWSSLRRVELIDANLTGTNFTLADMQEANLQNALAEGAVFDSALLNNANLEGACFHNASFDNAVLEGALLRKADFAGAKGLTSEQLKSAKMDETTILDEDLRRQC